MTTTVDDTQPVRDYYARLAELDLDGAVALFGDGFTLWSVPGRGELAGDFEGRAAIRAALERWSTGAYGTFTRDMHALCSAGDGDHVYAQYVLGRRADAEQTRVGVVDAWHVREGRLAHVWTFFEDQYAFDRWTGYPGTPAAEREERG